MLRPYGRNKEPATGKLGRSWAGFEREHAPPEAGSHRGPMSPLSPRPGIRRLTVNASIEDIDHSHAETKAQLPACGPQRVYWSWRASPPAPRTGNGETAPTC